MAVSAGELLKQARRRNGVSQAELAARVGTRQTTISRWERGERSPTVEKLTELLAAMGEELALATRPIPDKKTDAQPSDWLLYG